MSPRLALVALLHLVDGCTPGLDGLQGTLGMRLQSPASEGQANTTLGTFEDTRAQLILEGHDACTQGGLPEMQGPRSRAHRAEPRNLQEGFQPGDIHGA